MTFPSPAVPGGQFELLGGCLSAAAAKRRGDRRRLTESASTGLIAQDLIPLKNPADTLKRGHRTLGFFEIPRVGCPAFRLRRWVVGVFQQNQNLKLHPAQGRI